MRTLIDILKLSSDFLASKGIPNAKIEAQDLIADALGISRMQVYLDHERPLQNEELDLLRRRLARRAEGEPGAYIHGNVEFHGCTLKVSPQVLIPRQETALLVDKIITTLENVDLNGKVLWDLCCGSGCIGISLKKRFPQLTVVLSDLSPEALKIARENSVQNNVSVEFLQGDLLAPFSGKKADFIISNPPYISESDWTGLDREVRDFEPRMALVGGNSGLEFYERLSAAVFGYLNPHARLWLEMGTGQGESILTLFKGKGKVERDWAGHDRFFSLENE